MPRSMTTKLQEMQRRNAILSALVKGERCRAIADRFGVSHQAVSALGRRHGVTSPRRRTVTPRDPLSRCSLALQNAIATAYEHGIMLKDIQETTGLSRETVKAILDDRGIAIDRQRRSTSVPQDELAEIISLYDTGMSARQIGEQYGLGDAAILRRLHQAGHPTRGKRQGPRIRAECAS